jgi:hypothetical protein
VLPEICPKTVQQWTDDGRRRHVRRDDDEQSVTSVLVMAVLPSDLGPIEGRGENRVEPGAQENLVVRASAGEVDDVHREQNAVFDWVYASVKASWAASVAAWTSAP